MHMCCEKNIGYYTFSELFNCVYVLRGPLIDLKHEKWYLEVKHG